MSLFSVSHLGVGRTFRWKQSLRHELSFALWLTGRCVFRDRAWGGLRVLHRHYADWCVEGNFDVPAGVCTFTQLLRDEGALVTGSGLVYGVLLKEDAPPASMRGGEQG